MNILVAIQIQIIFILSILQQTYTQTILTPQYNTSIPNLQEQFDAFFPNTKIYDTIYFPVNLKCFMDYNNSTQFSYSLLTSGSFLSMTYTSAINYLLFQGTSTLSFINTTHVITLRVSNAHGYTDFQFQIDYHNVPPRVSDYYISLQQEFDTQNPFPQIGKIISYKFIVNPFVDDDNDQMIYTAEYRILEPDGVTERQTWGQLTGTWYYFNPTDLSFQGKPTMVALNTYYEIRVKASDGFVESQYLHYTIELLNNKPRLNTNNLSLQEQFDQQYPVPYNIINKKLFFVSIYSIFIDDDNDQMTNTITYIDDPAEVALYNSGNANSVTWLTLASDKWILVNEKTLYFTGLPTINEIDTIIVFRVVTSDGFEESDPTYLKIDFSDGAPVPASSLQSAGALQQMFDKQNPNPQIEREIKFQIESIPFTDPENDPLTYQVQYQDPLASDTTVWLELLSDNWFVFNENTYSFKGTPPVEYMDTLYNIRIRGYDGYKYSVYLYFTVDLENLPPAIYLDVDDLQTQFDSQVPNPQVEEEIYFQISQQPFYNQDSVDNLYWVVEYYDEDLGSYAELYDKWLEFNNATLVFQGTPSVDLINTNFTIKVTTNDGYKSSSSMYFTIDLSNYQPTLNLEIGTLQEQFDFLFENNQVIAHCKETFLFEYDSDTFSDKDDTSTESSLKYTAYIRKFSFQDQIWGEFLEITDNSDTWLYYNSKYSRFYGEPGVEDLASYEVKLVVSDGFDEINNIFGFSVTNSPPYLNKNQNLQSQLTKNPVVDSDFEFEFSSSTFIDEDKDDLDFTITMENGDMIPDYLIFDGSSRSLSGKFTEIRKVNPTGLSAYFYQEALTFVIQGEDNGEELVSDILVIEVSPSFWYIFILVIKFSSPIVGTLGLYKYRILIFELICKKRYQYRRRIEGKVGERFNFHIPLILEDLICWNKYWNMTKANCIKNVPKNVSSSNWFQHFFITDEAELNKSAIQGLVIAQLKNDPQFKDQELNIEDIQADSTGHRIILGLAAKELISSNSLLSSLYQNIKYLMSQKSVFVYNSTKQEIENLESPKDWYKELIKISYQDFEILEKYEKEENAELEEQDADTEPLKKNKKNTSKNQESDDLKGQFVIPNKFPELKIQRNKLKLIVKDLLISKYAGTKKPKKLNNNLSTKDKILNSKSKYYLLQDDKLIDKLVKLLEQGIISEALGTMDLDYQTTFRYNLCQGESLQVYEKDVVHIKAHTKVQPKGLGDKIKSKLTWLKLDYEEIPAKENKKGFPDWLDLRVNQGIITIFGKPKRNNVGETKFQVKSRTGYIIREFWILVQENQNQQVSQEKENINPFSKIQKLALGFNFSKNNNQNQQIIEINSDSDLEVSKHDNEKSDEKVIQKKHQNQISDKEKHQDQNQENKQDEENEVIQNEQKNSSDSGVPVIQKKTSILKMKSQFSLNNNDDDNQNQDIVKQFEEQNEKDYDDSKTQNKSVISKSPDSHKNLIQSQDSDEKQLNKSQNSNEVINEQVKKVDKNKNVKVNNKNKNGVYGQGQQESVYQKNLTSMFQFQKIDEISDLNDKKKILQEEDAQINQMLQELQKKKAESRQKQFIQKISVMGKILNLNKNKPYINNSCTNTEISQNSPSNLLLPQENIQQTFKSQYYQLQFQKTSSESSPSNNNINNHSNNNNNDNSNSNNNSNNNVSSSESMHKIDKQVNKINDVVNQQQIKENFRNLSQKNTLFPMIPKIDTQPSEDAIDQGLKSLKTGGQLDDENPFD